MIFIGDIHGNINLAIKIAKENPTEDVYQLGDFGFGFRTVNQRYSEFIVLGDDIINPELPPNLFFIRGNHDKPELCKKHPQYLGDYGYIEKHKMFFISGADSIDKENRTLGINWWEDEELSQSDLYAAMDLYEKVKPEIVISHDCPQSIMQCMFLIYDKARTRQALDCMLHLHRPKKWFFGHHHCNKQYGQIFRCLTIDEWIKFP